MSTQTSTYRDVKAISNSAMAIYEDDFNQFANWWHGGLPLREKKDDALTIGSAIDTLLTRPEEFEDRFVVYTGTAPTGQMLQFCNTLASLCDQCPELSEYYQRAYDQVGFKRDNLQKVLEKFEAYKSYYQFLVESKTKGVLTSDMALKVHGIVEQLETGRYTRELVNMCTEGPIEVFDQLEIYDTYPTEYGHIDVKGAIDRVVVNHELKMIVPIDFKSSYDVGNFQNSYRKYRYYRQASFYSHLLQGWAERQSWVGYRIMPFIFIVCSTSGGKHYKYVVSDHDLACAKSGGKLPGGQVIKGWHNILTEIRYLDMLNNWDYPYDATINDGSITLQLFENQN